MTVYEYLCSQGPGWIIDLQGITCSMCIHKGDGAGCKAPLGSCRDGMLAWYNQPLEDLPPVKPDLRYQVLGGPHDLSV